MGSKVRINPKEVTVTQLFGEMVNVMRQENPEVLDQMKLEQMVTDLNNAQESGDGMEEDLEADQSLEAKIEREVKRVVKNSFT